MKSLRFQILFLLAALLCIPASTYAAKSSATDVLSQIPVQQGGRIKPFQSFAQEVTLYVTGKTSYEGLSATEIVWQWMIEPETWNQKPFIPVSYKPLQQEFDAAVIKGRVSPETILTQQVFVEKVRIASLKKQNNEKLDQLDQKRIELYDKARLFREVGEGGVPGWVAHPDDPRKGWLPLQALAARDGQETLTQHFPPDKVDEVSKALQALFAAYHENGFSSQSEDAAYDFSDSLSELFDSRGIVLDRSVLNLEMQYLRLQPFHWAWILYLISALLGILHLMSFNLARFPKNNPVFYITSLLALTAFLAGFGFHAYGFYLRCVIAGRPPVSNMYESIVWVSLAVVVFSAILSFVYRSTFIRTVASLVAALALLIAQGFPTVLDPSIAPLVPVLRSNFWLTIHVLTITLSYGAFALAWGLGHAAIAGYTFWPQSRDVQQKLTQYVYRALQIGVVLLASGTVLGGVWANYSWGRFWGWDPKETWALIALLGYLTVLHGRFTGWLNSFGFVLWSTIAFLGILMAWYGVNFVLAAGLHSYGFGGGGVYYVLAAVAVDLVILMAMTLKYKIETRLQ